MPILEELAKITKFMEGELYILASSYWIALSQIEKVLAPHPGYSAPVAAFRLAMQRDHLDKRVTLAQSSQNPLHILMHLLDHRCVFSFS